MAPQTSAPTINLVRNDDLPPEDEIQHEEAWDHEPCGCRHCVGYHYDFWTVVDSPSVSVSIVQGLRRLFLPLTIQQRLFFDQTHHNHYCLQVLPVSQPLACR